MRRPKGVIFDVGSLKSPLRAGLNALKSHGCRVTSLHPMFGPDTELLSGRHVIFVEAGSSEATQAARELFASTMVEQVVMSLDEHDRLIAYVLGLSHALNIAFFTALAESGEAAPRLAKLSSTTFDSQLDVATRVAQESPELYFEIQSLNDTTGRIARSAGAGGGAIAHRRDFAGFRIVRDAHAAWARVPKTAVRSPSGVRERPRAIHTRARRRNCVSGCAR
jgi:prephenate dehydrogenase